MIASSFSSGERRFSKGSKMTNIEPKFEPLAACTNEYPATVSVCTTPGVCRVISSIFASASLVRSKEAESGSWTATHDSALVLLRDIPPRGRLEDGNTSSTSSPPYTANTTMLIRSSRPTAQA